MRAARLDAIDWQILQALQEDGRITNIELSQRIGISAPPCLRRVRALEEAVLILQRLLFSMERTAMRPKGYGSTLAFAAMLFGGVSMAAGIAPAQNQPIAGRLKCDVSGGVSFIVGSSRQLDCIFMPNNQPPEYYIGDIKRFGIDVGYERKGVIVWDVISPALKKGPGALSGTYSGVSADASLGAGLEANVLVGDNKIVLNPVSVGAELGINVAAGIGEIDLTYQDGSPPPDLRDTMPMEPAS
jgi:hypothetical protein